MYIYMSNSIQYHDNFRDKVMKQKKTQKVVSNLDKSKS